MPILQFLDGLASDYMRGYFGEYVLANKVDADEVPSVPLESNPGDVVFFNQNLWHASFGGETGRRMFTLNFGEMPRTDDDIAYLKRTYESNLGFVKSMQHTQTGRVYEECFLNSNSPRIRGMVSKLIELGFK